MIKNHFKYTSADTIPAKLYFKILATEELTLLTSEKLFQKELLEIWETIQDEDAAMNPGQKADKIINVSKKIEAIAAKFEFTEIAVFYLSRQKDEELIEQLKKFNFKFSDNFSNDLEKISRENKALKIRIHRLQKQLPTNETTSSKTTFDENVLSYATITQQGFINTNEITLSQYRALIKIGNQKIKALENGQ